MITTSRRNVLRTIVSGGVLAGATPLAAQHTQQMIAGPLAHATVAFGQWNTPVDRFSGAFTPANIGHHVSPSEVTIAAGGSVSFLIGGFHLLLVYDNGIQYADIDASLQIPGPPVELVDDPTNRIYRGPDPRSNPLDRIEVVHFHHPGTYLAVCGVLPHFNDHMYGFVKVIGG
jgi:hypothetical protein